MNVLNRRKQKETKEPISPRKRFWRAMAICALVFLVGLAYIYLFSDSNYKRHGQLNEKLRQIEQENAKLEKYLESTHTADEIKQDSLLMERHIREQLLMKRNNEDAFIIEHKEVSDED